MHVDAAGAEWKEAAIGVRRDQTIGRFALPHVPDRQRHYQCQVDALQTGRVGEHRGHGIPARLKMAHRFVGVAREARDGSEVSLDHPPLLGGDWVVAGNQRAKVLLALAAGSHHSLLSTLTERLQIVAPQVGRELRPDLDET
jgi:hypothetical protein